MDFNTFVQLELGAIEAEAELDYYAEQQKGDVKNDE